MKFPHWMGVDTPEEKRTAIVAIVLFMILVGGVWYALVIVKPAPIDYEDHQSQPEYDYCRTKGSYAFGYTRQKDAFFQSVHPENVILCCCFRQSMYPHNRCELFDAQTNQSLGLVMKEYDERCE